MLPFSMAAVTMKNFDVLDDCRENLQKLSRTLLQEVIYFR